MKFILLFYQCCRRRQSYRCGQCNFHPPTSADQIAEGVGSGQSRARQDPIHCSTVVVAFAFAGRLRPPVPTEYFGNCVRPCFVDVKAEDLIRGDGFVVASAAIGRVIQELKADLLHDAEEWSGRAQAAIAEQVLTVAGSPRFRVYDTDMGWGRPNKVEVTSIRTSGAILVGESREDEGGVEVSLVLP
ncbi:hypothetical protein BHM03_00036693 [Ensete ventricosum]|uniref:Uncharacterized protein n=1 Tax=Ensete ventricosum TaxID=4639 RepID=A0A445MJJ0_ENSVE|nr:hypothetical protein BHM03_00036693 [Ensete ventricosum]